jgi:hypothetical protein
MYMHGPGFNWQNEPIDANDVYVSGGRKANFVNSMCYDTKLLIFTFFKGFPYSMEWLTQGKTF